MDYAKLTSWIQKQAARIAYGEITVKIYKHDNQFRLIEKTVLEKEKPETGAADE
jgi:hypothetical protein